MSLLSLSVEGGMNCRAPALLLVGAGLLWPFCPFAVPLRITGAARRRMAHCRGGCVCSPGSVLAWQSLGGRPQVISALATPQSLFRLLLPSTWVLVGQELGPASRHVPLPP